MLSTPSEMPRSVYRAGVLLQAISSQSGFRTGGYAISIVSSSWLVPISAAAQVGSLHAQGVGLHTPRWRESAGMVSRLSRRITSWCPRTRCFYAVLGYRHDESKTGAARPIFQWENPEPIDENRHDTAKPYYRRLTCVTLISRDPLPSGTVHSTSPHGKASDNGPVRRWNIRGRRIRFHRCSGRPCDIECMFRLSASLNGRGCYRHAGDQNLESTDGRCRGGDGVGWGCRRYRFGYCRKES